MATSYTTTIKNLKPQGWSRQTVADGQALNNSFLEPTHQKDLKLAEGLDATNDRIDSVNTQMTELGQRVSNAETTVANIGEDVRAYDQEIAQLNSNLQIVSAAEGDLATSLGTVTEKLNEHKDLVTVDKTTIAGDGSTENPYTVIGGGGGGGSSKVYVPNVDGGNLSYTLSAASAAETQIGPWDIKGPKGENGAPGEPGVGLSADATTLLEARKTTVSIWEKGAEEPDTTFDLPFGQDGYTPEFTITDIPALPDAGAEHKNGGTEITIKYGPGEHDTTSYSAWNGNDGSMAGAPDIEGTNGLSAAYNGSKYFVGLSGNVYIPTLSAGSAQNAGSTTSAYQALYYYDVVEERTFRIDSQINGLWEQVNDVYVEPGGVWRTYPIYADYALSAYIGENNISGFNHFVDAINAKLDTTAAAAAYQPKGNYATTQDISDMATKTWVGEQGYLTSIPDSYATKTYANEASAYALSQAKTYADGTSAEALSQAKSWTNLQNFATSAGLAANIRYEMTNAGWTSAIKIQVDTQAPTADDGILHIILES